MKKHLSTARLQDILDRFGELQVGVIGDLALDAYWYADMTQSYLSRETPLFPRPVVREVYAPGAGANVADNLAALGVRKVVAFSVIGDDWRGQLLRRELTGRGISVEQLVVSDQRTTSCYVKPILMGFDSQQEDPRLDFSNAVPLDGPSVEALIDRISREITNLDALLVADQFELNGIIADPVLDALNQLAADHPATHFVVDSRQRIGLFSHMVLKPNWVEAGAAIYPHRDPRDLSQEQLVEVGKLLSQRSSRPAFITLSNRGALVCTEAEQVRVPAGPVQPPLDPVGAGDTFVAALAASLAAGAAPAEAAAVANLAASITVEKLNQTGTATPEEIVVRYELASTQEDSR
ncbi:MAG: PfkB family carbohydrate kinase [Chloroflexota bacterium]|nr:PfkB family carbohydrate kinase [Chloroflexota bacterium]